MELSAGLSFHGMLGGKASSVGTKEPWLEFLTGADFHRMSGRWNMLDRLINRRNDRYREVIKDGETGAIIRYIDEPLSRHQGRGSAKRATRP